MSSADIQKSATVLPCFDLLYVEAAVTK